MMVIGRFGSTKVLIVEDDEFTQLLVGRILENIGVAKSIAVGSGADAITHLSNEESSIDLIVCDIEMPGMDGWELVHKLRLGDVPRYKNVPVLMLTGADTPKNIRRGKFNKIEAFLVKPPEIDSLRKHMALALGFA